MMIKIDDVHNDYDDDVYYAILETQELVEEDACDILSTEIVTDLQIDMRDYIEEFVEFLRALIKEVLYHRISSFQF